MKTYTPRATPSGQLLGGSNKKASPMDVPAGLAYPHPPKYASSLPLSVHCVKSRRAFLLPRIR